MVSLVKISKPELIKMISVAYEGDTELFDKYHVGKMGFMDCVFSTMDMIRDCAVERELRYYKVVYQKIGIGYVVEFDDFLYSYGINIKYRKKPILIAWWNAVRSIMGNNFMTMLYENNIRAIEHLKLQGFEVLIEDKENHSVTLVYNKNKNRLKVA